MKKTFLMLLFLISGLAYAQDNHTVFWLYAKNLGYNDDNHIGKEGIIGVKNCYVRETPSTSGKLIDSLQLGKKVMVNTLAETTQKIKGISMNWAEIQYASGNGIKKGYLWLGFLAIDFKETESLTFMTVLERINTRKDEDGSSAPEFVLAAKVLDKSNVLLDSKEVRKNIVESYFYRQDLMGNFGLQNIQNLYRFSFSGEACGIPTYFFYFGWTGKKLLVMPEKMAVGDAGVYYYSENFIFPNETGGKQGFIYKVIEEAEEQESANQNESVMLEKSWKETYSWDGEQAKLIKKNLLRQELVKQ